MNERAICNVATGAYVKGQRRLMREFPGERMILWADKMPTYSPDHADMPYAFKAWALKAAACTHHASTLLWVDACIVAGKRSLEDLWCKIERDGYWIMRNGYKNSQWTNKNALPFLGVTQAENEGIEHVVATAFGVSLATVIGHAILDEYLKYAQNGSFIGPWVGGEGVQHRHDQTALSVVAWKVGAQLSECPEWFSYKGGETDKTCLIADGEYA